MASVPDEFYDFSRFVNEQMSDQMDGLSLEESLAAFRVYQKELSRFKNKIQPALDELNESGGSDLEMDSIITRGRQQLAEEGISE